MTRVKTVLCVCLLAMLTGCGIDGRWETVSFEPDVARDDFRLADKPNGEDGFTKAIITLYEDGTYVADVYYGTTVDQSKGQWQHRKDKLTLTNEDGESFTYEIDVSGWGSKLEMVRQIKGTEVTLELRRLPLED